ncbi:hypothetical protein K501DRAFT_242929 [Backusella circina FSU 941]|nr:hypothetical protein K501DRAFT_242929 [Backusella circina FSU 941]
MVHRNTPCTECRNHRRKCIRDSLNDTCSRCRRLDRTCMTTSTTSLSYSENSKHVIQQIDYLSAIVSDLENQLDLAQNSLSTGGDWKLTIKNGTLRIETGIKSIADLLLHCPPIPFQIPREETGLVVQFSPRKNICLRLLTSKLLVKCLDIIQDTSLSILSLPTSFLLDARSVIDHLIHIYFECHNTFHPLIHQPSFMAYYKQLDNPLDSLICLCICCHVCGAPCQHTLRSYGNLAAIGKYFSGLAKMKLMEQFDRKEKRIENMISINLLGSYLHFILLNSESKKISSINYQIAIDLLPWYKEECENGSVECALYSRNIALIMRYQKPMGLPDERCLSQTTWRAMPDEPRELIDFVDGHNLLFRLYNHAIMSELKSRTRDVLSGGVCALPFEMIVQMDEVIHAWWNGLPERYKLCDSWLDVDQCRQRINETVDGVALITFIDFLNYMVGVYSQMLQPKSITDSSVLSFVEKVILERALYCCQMVLCGFNKANWLDMSSPCRYILAMKWYLIRIADVLIALSSSSNNTIKEEAKSMLKSCISAIESMTYIKQDATNSIEPPPLFGKGSVSFEDLDDINLLAYSNYPQPWYALIYDICRCLTSNSIA